MKYECLIFKNGNSRVEKTAHLTQFGAHKIVVIWNSVNFNNSIYEQAHKIE